MIKLLARIFFERTINDPIYLDFLQNHLKIFWGHSTGCLPEVLVSTVGAPTHYSQDVWIFLDELYLNHWIRWKGSVDGSVVFRLLSGNNYYAIYPKLHNYFFSKILNIIYWCLIHKRLHPHKKKSGEWAGHWISPYILLTISKGILKIILNYSCIMGWIVLLEYILLKYYSLYQKDSSSRNCVLGKCRYRCDVKFSL